MANRSTKDNLFSKMRGFTCPSPRTVGLLVLALAPTGLTRTVKTPTPQMGWNSYNAYGCDINEGIIVSNAKGLVRSGLSKLGYEYVTPDCGWYGERSEETGALEWNATRFPSGGASLSKKVHGLGLKFGMYSGAGYWQCGGLDKNPGSLGTSSPSLLFPYIAKIGLKGMRL